MVEIVQEKIKVTLDLMAQGLMNNVDLVNPKKVNLEEKDGIETYNEDGIHLLSIKDLSVYCENGKKVME